MSAAYALTAVTFRHPDAAPGAPGLVVPELALEAGKVTALTGPNGAGKTTLLHLLGFLLPPTSGTLAFFGREVAPGGAAAARRRVGLVAQNPYLVQGTVADNVGLGLRVRGVARAEARRRVAEALERYGLAPLAGRRVRGLSGGEAQKVAIARALVLDPEVLLLDEPFTHLDGPYLGQVEALVADLCRTRGRTVVFTTHDLARAWAVSDRVCGLVGGRVVPASLLNLFRGRLDRAAGVFDTGRVRIQVPEGCPDGTHLAVEPNHVVLSTGPLASSMRNTFPGRVTEMAEAGGRVRVRVEAGEAFVTEVTAASAVDQGLRPGLAVWVSFKSTGMTIF